MGRPLKIKKVIETGGNTGVDIGFNAFNQLTNPVLPTGTFSTANYVGVVGGSNTVDTANYPTIKVTCDILKADGTGAGDADGYIIRQKGAHKFLVGDTTSVADEDIEIGNSYRIVTVGTTDWTLFGAPVGYNVGTIFTATANGSDSGNGVCNLVGVCVLQNDTTPDAGNVCITMTADGDSSTEIAISKITNKWALDWTGGSGYAPTEVVNDLRYAVNFFSDDGTEIKSGTAQETVDLALVENYNS